MPGNHSFSRQNRSFGTPHLNSGYHLAFLVGAVFIVTSAVVGAALLRVESPQAHGREEAIGAPAAAEAD